MRNFLVNEIRAGQALITGQDAQHLQRVLRYKIGERILISDGCGSLYRSRITAAEENQVIVQVEAKLFPEECPVRITLAQGLLKGDKNDFVVQKITELGAAAYAPLSLARSIVKLDSKKRVQRRERWQKIAKEAVKQCGRATVPEIYPLQSLEELLEKADDYDLIVFPWEEEQQISIREIQQSEQKYTNILCILGPEGGMTEAEMNLVKNKKGKIVTLGKRILRAETAAIAVLAVMQYTLGDLG